MSQTPTTRRQLRERVTPTDKEDGNHTPGSADGKDSETPKGATLAKIRTRLSTGTLIMNGTSTLRERDFRPSPTITPDRDGSVKSQKDGAAASKRRAAEPASTVVRPKQRKLAHSDGQEVFQDLYCWVCHKDDCNAHCQVCPRSYHLKCLMLSSAPTDWVCLECEKCVRAECTDTCSKAMSQLSTDTLCLLLRFALDRMRQPGSEVFQTPVNSADIPMYSDFVCNAMDFTVLDKNIKNKQYGSTEAFLADAKWILHNCIIFNGVHHKLTTVARNVVKSCKHEMSEIEVCPQCYQHSCSDSSDWFTQPCEPPHTLVWAKLKGYPFWPAKALQEVNGQVDVRFFGAHDMSWIPLSQVFLLSKETPTVMKKKGGGFGSSMEEMEKHISVLRKKYGKFDYAPYRTPYDRRHVYMNNKLKCVNMKTAKRFKLSAYMKMANKDMALKVKSKYSTMATKKSAVIVGLGQVRQQLTASANQVSLDKPPSSAINYASASMNSSPVEAAEDHDGGAAVGSTNVPTSVPASASLVDVVQRKLQMRLEMEEVEDEEENEKKDEEKEMEGCGKSGQESKGEVTVEESADISKEKGLAGEKHSAGEKVSETSEKSFDGEVSGKDCAAEKTVIASALEETVASSEYGEEKSSCTDTNSAMQDEKGANTAVGTDGCAATELCKDESEERKNAVQKEQSEEIKKTVQKVRSASDNVTANEKEKRESEGSVDCGEAEGSLDFKDSDISPKLEYKESLLKTIEACKGKLGITAVDDTFESEAMEVSDEEESVEEKDITETEEKDAVNDESKSDRESENGAVSVQTESKSLAGSQDVEREAKSGSDSKVENGTDSIPLDIPLEENTSASHSSTDPVLEKVDELDSSSKDKETEASRKESGKSLLKGEVSSSVACVTVVATEDFSGRGEKRVLPFVSECSEVTFTTIKPIMTAKTSQSTSDTVHKMSTQSPQTCTKSVELPLQSPKPVAQSPRLPSESSKLKAHSPKPDKDHSKQKDMGSLPSKSDLQKWEPIVKIIRVEPVACNQSDTSSKVLMAVSTQDTICKETASKVKTTATSSQPSSESLPPSSASSKTKFVHFTNGCDDDEEEEPDLLMEVESEADNDALIIDLEEEDLDLQEVETTSSPADFLRELAPSSAVIRSMKKIQDDFGGRSKLSHKLKKMSGKVNDSVLTPSSKSPHFTASASPPCVLVDVRSLSGMEHDWKDVGSTNQELPSPPPSLPSLNLHNSESAVVSADPPLPSLDSSPSSLSCPLSVLSVPTISVTAASSMTSSSTSSTGQEFIQLVACEASASHNPSLSTATSMCGEKSKSDEEASLNPAAVNLVNKFSQQIVGNMQLKLAEMCKELLGSVPTERDTELKLQKLRQKLMWTHERQMSEIQHNHKMTIAEMKACWEAEKCKAVSDTRKKMIKEKEEAIMETKKKQWCSCCWKEALYYCCWNTSYCSYSCQQRHWAQHQLLCRQALEAQANSTADSTTTQDVAVAVNTAPPPGGKGLVVESDVVAMAAGNAGKCVAGSVGDKDDIWRHRLPMSTHGLGQNMHFIPNQQPQPQPPPPSQPLQQLQYLQSLRAPHSATFQPNQVQLLTHRPTLNTVLPSGQVVSNNMVFPLLRSPTGAQSLVINRPMHYQHVWKNC